ncbi:decapping enzyme, scavenger [Arctopsyche grandis]|uniref:decapping enzyme, scavenger n=1 Tax=Arctopsyche grandis TaxID=121162 RepID=UPI00406D8455
MSESKEPPPAHDESSTNGVKEVETEPKVEVSPRLFVPKDVLKSGRVACLEGEIRGQKSLLLLERKEFSPADLLAGRYTGSDLTCDQIFQNDIYSRYVLFPKGPADGLKATLVSPCTQKHIDKYRQHNSYMVLETPQIYLEITLPHLKKDQFNLQWLYNIFSGEKEADRILHRDKDEDERGIILLPDLHWDGIDQNNFHLLAFPLKRGILSIRDLTNKDLPLLYHIRDKSIEIVKQKFGFKREHLRMYFHYQPSFYHLHVHVTYLHHEAPGIFTEKAHLLDTVIDNIELISDYYQRASLPFTVRETDALFTVYKDAGIVADHVLAKE